MSTNKKPAKMKTHYLKTWPEFFGEIIAKRKRFEVRKNDRDFKVGDILILEEWNKVTKEYTGKAVAVGISYILKDPNFGIEDGYCVLSLGDLMNL